MNPISLISLFGAAMVKDRIKRAKQRAALFAVAALMGIIALIWFLSALQIWVAESFGPLYASLMLGAAFLVVAIGCIVGAKVIAGSTPPASDYTKPAMRETTKYIARQRFAFASKAPMVIGTTAVLGGLIGRFLIR